ncbi:MAG: hypothetical protein P1U74_07070 [Legionellaceae bacterium]|nr:hypothetical protein [Legionellaceae bacterium]
MPDLAFSAGDLVADTKRHLSIEDKGEELQRLEFALKVYIREQQDSTSNLDPYTDDDSENAQLYLIKHLRLPNTSNRSEVIEAVENKIEHLKNTTLTPSSNTVHAQMSRIKSIEVIGDFFSDQDEDTTQLWIQDINVFVGEINGYIKQYNSEEDLQNKRSLLTKINELKMAIEHNTPSDLVFYTNYSKVIHHTLSDSIMSESGKIRELDQIFNPSGDYQSRTERQKLAIMLEVMPAEYIERLAYNLIIERSDLEGSTLANLILPHEPGYAEFQDFFTRNSFVFEGGSNSLNFRITSQDGLEEFIFKFEDRMGYTKTVEDRLRQSDFNKYLTSVDGERQISCQGRTSTILLTDFYPDGNLLQYRKKLTATEEVERTALVFFSQMGEMFISLSEEDAATTDSKLTNWLIKDGQLSIADTKPFISTENGLITKDATGRDNYERHKLIGTPGYTTPEMKGSSYSSDKMNSWMYGKNLYVYMTKNPGKFTYDRACFQTPAGVQIAQLIRDLTKTNPDERPSMQEALMTLQKIKLEHNLENIQESSLEEENPHAEQIQDKIIKTRRNKQEHENAGSISRWTIFNRVDASKKVTSQYKSAQQDDKSSQQDDDETDENRNNNRRM